MERVKLDPKTWEPLGHLKLDIGRLLVVAELNNWKMQELWNEFKPKTETSQGQLGGQKFWNL